MKRLLLDFSFLTTASQCSEADELSHICLGVNWRRLIISECTGIQMASQSHVEEVGKDVMLD